jgi:hypothetical protein
MNRKWSNTSSRSVPVVGYAYYKLFPAEIFTAFHLNNAVYNQRQLHYHIFDMCCTIFI